MPWIPVIAAGVSAAGGIAAASMGNKGSQSSSLNLGPTSYLEHILYGDGSTQITPGKEAEVAAARERYKREKFGGQFMADYELDRLIAADNPSLFTKLPGQIAGQFNELQSLYARTMPGQEDVTKGYDAQRSLAEMLQQYSQTGGMPTQQDFRNADGLFSPRQQQLNSMFEDQSTESDRLAARLGRPVNDPILQAKLRTGFMRQQDQLNAEKMGMADQLSQRRLGYATDRTNVLGNLASQAFANRTAILSLGSQLGNNERDFRLRAAGSNTTSVQGGGLRDAIAGGITGAAGGLQLGQGLSNLFKTPSGGGNWTGAGENVGYGGGAANYSLGVNTQMPTIPGWGG